MTSGTTGPLVWANGRLVPADEPLVRHDDHGLVVGDGVFETLRATARGTFAVRRHLDRLRRSAAGLGLAVPYDDDTLRVAIDAVVAVAPWEDCRVRVTVTAGIGPLGSLRGSGPATVVVAAGPMGPIGVTASVVVVPWPRNERGAVAGLKTTSYAENVLALRFAKERGGDEAIFGNTVGHLCEGTGSNVFVVVGDELLTPPLSAGCLAGVTRDLLLEAGVGREADIALSTFLGAEEAFLTSTGRDVQPIARIDGRALPGIGGRHTAAAAAAFASIAEQLDP